MLPAVLIYRGQWSLDSIHRRPLPVAASLFYIQMKFAHIQRLVT
jgi:hypothetical protein